MHAFSGAAAVGVEQEAVVPRVSAEEDVGVAQRRDLCPVNLRVPRQVGPFPVANGGGALGQVPMQRLHGVVVLAGRAPHLDGHRVTVVGRAPGAEVELRGNEAVRIERVTACVNLVDEGQFAVQGRTGTAILSGGEESADESVVRVGGIVRTRLRVPPVLGSHVAVVHVSAGRRPTTRAARSAAVSRITSGDEAHAGARNAVHGIGLNGDGNGLFLHVVFVAVVLWVIHRGPQNQATMKFVGGRVQNGVSHVRRPNNGGGIRTDRTQQFTGVP